MNKQVTEEDVKNNPDEDLQADETVETPNSPGTEIEGVTTQESKSGESTDHIESMNSKHGTEKNLREEDKNVLPPVAEQNGQSEAKASDFKKNKSGESHLKAEREKGDQGLH